MHIHHLTLRKLAEWLNREASGAIFGEAFTQEKDQVLIGLGTPRGDLYLRVACAAPLPHIWPQDHSGKARRNVLELFQRLVGLPFLGAEAVPWERVLLLHFEGAHTLALKMHGLLSNVLLLHEGAVVERFRHNHEPDLAFQPSPGPFDIDWRDSAEHGEGLPTLDRIRLISPVFDKRFAARTDQWIAQGLPFTDAFQRVLDEATDGDFHLLRDPKRLQFMLFPLDGAPMQHFADIRRALDAFLRNWHQYDAYARQHDLTRKAIDRQLTRVQGQVNSAKATIHKISTERPPEETGHILMANLHLLEQGMETVELHDFYLDQPIAIKLRTDLNPQQNAEEYYNKQKKHKARVRYLEGQLQALEAEWMVWMEADAQFRKLPLPQDLPQGEHGIDPKPSRELAAFMKVHGQQLSQGKTEAVERKHPFLEFQCMGYTILAGKNAKQNDALTFGYSKKTDFWLHARDAFGSHVIVRNPTGRDLPTPVLEYAAGLAARHSKRKHEKLVPVQYTPRKYIRKMKDGAPGQVIVEREKVLMIEPLPED